VKLGKGGYNFRPAMIKDDIPPLRGPMLAGKCLDKFTASDKFSTLPYSRKPDVEGRALSMSKCRIEL